jgi:hypothetical protein
MSEIPEQINLFDIEPDWAKLWEGMPEFNQKDLTPWHSLLIHFQKPSDFKKFSELIDQPLSIDTRSVWYPKAEIGRMMDKLFVSQETVQPAYPIYIVSKGRYEKRLTSDSIAKMGIPHYLVVEDQEKELYRKYASPLADILVLDPTYQKNYDTFDDLGDSKSKGPGAARNFAWDHSISNGHKQHWVMDDNIDGFYRLFNNIKTPTNTGSIFRAMEGFVDRYSNVGMSGPNYFMFASRKTVMPPFTMNTRIYSCNLIRNDVPFRWRGRYNEDTDLSLRILLHGLCTVQFNAFLQMKLTTQTLKGGNTDAFYAKEGTKPKSEMLVKMHPTLARIAFKFGRWHHHVNYKVFTNELILKDGLDSSKGKDDFGMSLKFLDTEKR